MANFVVVPGAWHVAAHWRDVLDRLVEAGHHALAVDLPTGPELGLAEYRDAVVGVLREVAAHGKVTLVGHSFAGLTITLVAEAVPDLLERLVYVTAYVPVELPNALGYRGLPESEASLTGTVLVGDPLATGLISIDPRGDTEKIRMAYYTDVPPAEFGRFAALLRPDLPAKIALDDARGTPGRWGRVPRTFIRCALDRGMTPALQDRMIKEADEATPDNPFEVHTLESAHSPFASMPGRLASLLARS